AWHAEVESLDSLVLNGVGASDAAGIVAVAAPNVVIEGNQGLVVAAGSTLSAVIDTAVSGTPPVTSIGTPSAVKAVRTVSASGAEARGQGVGTSAENKFSNAEGVANSLGIGVFGAPFAVVANNGVSATSLVISIAGAHGIPAPMEITETEAFALGEAVSTGIYVVGSDFAQVLGNTVGARAAGETAADSAAETGAPISIAGPFALADVSATAAGIVVEGGKSTVNRPIRIAGNRVQGGAEGSAMAAGFEQVSPMLAQGWAFGTADVAGIVALGVDRIRVEGNGVMMMGVAGAFGVAAQRIEPAPLGEAAATTWGMGLGIGVVASLEPSVSKNTVGLLNAAGMRVGADSAAEPDAALAQGVVDATGILVAGAVRPVIAGNGVGVLGLGALLPREELMAILKEASSGTFAALKKVEEVRQCHIEVFATGIEVVGGYGGASSADVVGNVLAGMFKGPDDAGIGVFAMSACEPPPGPDDGDGGPIVLHPEALSVAGADAAGIFVAGMPGSHVNDNTVDARALSFGLTRALPPGHPMLPPPSPVPAGDAVVAAGISEAFSQGITVIGSPDTEIARNSVGAHNELMVVALAADKVGTDTPFGLAAPASGRLRDRSLQTLSHGGHDVASVSGLGVAQGIGVFGSPCSDEILCSIKGNNVGAGSRGFVMGAAIDSHPLLGDAFTFGSVVNVTFGIMVDHISDGNWVVDNNVSADADSSQRGFAEAITREDPLVIGETVAIAVGIDNYDSFLTLISGNNVDAKANSNGSAFAHELIVPLEAFATQLGLS
ncbi:MAG: hypothetical protein HY681_01690, partial [Chloroflexi bacterium]|nr:hypothetical protein [Chloroflexota bacterium]